MASEWEELEKLTKEDLIIEFVKERTAVATWTAYCARSSRSSTQ